MVLSDRDEAKLEDLNRVSFAPHFLEFEPRIFSLHSNDQSPVLLAKTVEIKSSIPSTSSYLDYQKKKLRIPNTDFLYTPLLTYTSDALVVIAVLAVLVTPAVFVTLAVHAVLVTCCICILAVFVFPSSRWSGE